MSLTANKDSNALSLAVELNEDGSIIDSSIVVSPSLIRVSYRLTYDDVDEMLAAGIGYSEEWELGVLLHAATVRREMRMRQGSAEAFVPTPIPQYSISTRSDPQSEDGTNIKIGVVASHNSGKNFTAHAETSTGSQINSYESPASAASLLVTGEIADFRANWKKK